MIIRQAAGCIVYTLDECNIIYYLLLRYQAGHWDFAKGHAEARESLVQTAHRELYEETGLIVQVNDEFHYTYSYDLVVNHQQAFKTVHLFIAQTNHRSIALSWEHSDYAWLCLDQALSTLTYANAQEALRAADSFIIRP